MDTPPPPPPPENVNSAANPPANPPDDHWDLGSAIFDKKFRFTSATQITLFDRDHEGCPRKFYYQYVERKKPPETEAQRVGKELAKNLYHYLTTSEDVLPPVLQEARRFFPHPGPDLECEQPLGENVSRALFLRDSFLRLNLYADRDMLLRGIRRDAGITACDIPLIGAADIRHRRQVWVDEEGMTHREDPSLRVTSILDLKSTFRLWAKTLPNGEVLRSYAKTSAEVVDTPQMVIYAMQEVLKHPEITHIRSQHVYAQKKPYAASIRGGLISVDEVRRRFRRVETVVEKMVGVVQGATSPLDVEPNYDACDAYGGCFHKAYCPRPVLEATSTLLGNIREIGMGTSLLDAEPSSPSLSPPAPSAASSYPPPDSPEHQQMVEEEKKKLLEQVNGPPPPPVFEKAVPEPKRGSKIPVTACDIVRSYFVDCEDGDNPRYMEFKGSSKGKYFFVDSKLGWRINLETSANVWEAILEETLVPPPPPPPSPQVSIGQIVPPDAPKPTLLDSASPLPPEVVARIQDEELLKKVEAHNQAHRERQKMMDMQTDKKTSGRCAGGNQTLPLTIEIAMAKKATCSECGEVRRIKLDAQAQTFLFPGHNMPDLAAKDVAAAVNALGGSTQNGGQNGHTVVDEEEEDDSGIAPVLPGQEVLPMMAPPPPPPPSMSMTSEDRVVLKTEFLKIWTEVDRMVKHFLQST